MSGMDKGKGMRSPYLHTSFSFFINGSVWVCSLTFLAQVGNFNSNATVLSPCQKFFINVSTVCLDKQNNQPNALQMFAQLASIFLAWISGGVANAITEEIQLYT